MSEVVHLRGQGGAVWEMTLPLQPAIQKQYDAGDLQQVNADGSPYEEPPAAPKRTRAPKAVAEGA